MRIENPRVGGSIPLCMDAPVSRRPRMAESDHLLRIRNHFERNVSGVVNNIKFLAVANGEAVHGVECAHPRGKRHDFESIAQGRFITTFEVDIERAVEGGGAGYRVAVKTGQAGDTDFQRAD